MSKSPAFSVVVPLYNKAAHIRSTLLSCLGQRLKPLEIIVVDDGSTDQGGDVVQALGEPGIRLIRQANGGVARARNTGIQEARGDWVVFLDADDWQHPLFLESLAAVIARFPQADMAGTQYRSVAAESFRTPQAWPVDPAQAPMELITDLPRRWPQGSTFFTSSVAVRASRLRNLQPCFPPGENYGEDMDLWFRLGEATPIAWHSAPLVARVWVPDGLSVTQHVLNEAPYLLRMEARALAGQMPAALSASTLAFVDHHRISLARAAISAGQRGQALRTLWRAKRHWADKRWLLSLLMIGLVPGALVHRWQHWRKRRKMVLG
jgi:glycosyltransferase involved in cell wall biosynthesis